MAEPDDADDEEGQTPDQKILDEAKKRFQESDDQWSEVKNMYVEDVRFGRRGEQWPPDVLQGRTDEGRPALTINKIPAFARQIVNDMRKNRPRIKTRAANGGACSETAKILDGIIRNIETISNADVAYDNAGEDAVYGGIGFFRVDIDYEYDDSFDMGIFIRPIANPCSVSWDAHPEEGSSDSAGWRYCFVSEMVDREQFEDDYPDAIDMDFGDGPLDMSWRTSDCVRVSEYWKREEEEIELLLLANGMIVRADALAQLGPEEAALPDLQVVNRRPSKSYKVTQYLMTGAQILKTTEWPGCQIPIVPVWGDEVNIEGQTYYHSLIRDVKDAQRMFNYWRTTATELVALAPKTPFIGEDGAFDTDIEKWNSANTKTWPFITYKKGAQMPQRQPYAGLPAGALSEAANASDDMKAILGMFDASLGAKSNETSGIAIQRRMAEGDNSSFHFIDNLNRAIRCAGRIVVDLIPKVYNKPRVMRVMGYDGKCESVHVNQPTQGKDDNGAMVDRIYDLTAGKYDVVVEAGPSYTTQRTENAEMLTQIMSAAPATAPLLAAELMKMSDFPDAERAAKILATMMPPAARAVFDGTPPPSPQPPPEIIAAQQKAMADIEINKQKTGQEAQLEQQKAQNRAVIERQQADADIAVMREKANAEMEIERQRAEMQFQLKQKEAQMQIDIELLKFQHEIETTPQRRQISNTLTPSL